MNYSLGPLSRGPVDFLLLDTMLLNNFRMTVLDASCAVCTWLLRLAAGITN